MRAEDEAVPVNKVSSTGGIATQRFREELRRRLAHMIEVSRRNSDATGYADRLSHNADIILAACAVRTAGSNGEPAEEASDGQAARRR